jgi:S-disulfanyl-L-cysteine oxidoreductase SoxD
MSISRELAVVATLLCTSAAASAQTAAYPGIGRAATPAEVRAWDIDVRPDLKGLPPGSGSVAQGMQVWDAKCASCHGVFGESNQTFAPLVGGTTAADAANGRVASLADNSYPGRTTLMKLAHLSTLWDYIRRAMPWTQPKSLTNDEVYAVTAYLLQLGGIVPESFVLSDRNFAEVQQRLPNRNGLTTEHGLWPGRGFGNGGRPDVAATACMTNCGPAPAIASSMPEHARDAHGNLAEQNRAVGPQRGVQTLPPQRAAIAAAAAPVVPAAALLKQHACTACHDAEQRIVGPSFREIGARHAGRPDAVAYLAGRIRNGGAGQWGAVPMPPQPLPDADARVIAQWLAGSP